MRSFVVVDTLELVIERLRTLNEQVPRPRRLPSESEVAGAEERAGVRLHDDLRHYLVAASDVVFGTIEPVTLGGGHTDFESVLQRREAIRSSGRVDSVCEDNGDYYCITSDGEVVYWSHNGTTDERWPDRRRHGSRRSGSAATELQTGTRFTR